LRVFYAAVRAAAAADAGKLSCTHRPLARVYSTRRRRFFRRGLVMKLSLFALALSGLCLAGVISAAELPVDAVPPKAVPFEPGEVMLLPGPYEHHVELDAKFLLSLEPDRLLSWFRKEAGLEPKGEVYGGWESQGIAGHCLGHYLSACARAYRATGDEEFRKRVDYIVAELQACQEASGDGFLGAMPNGKRVFSEVARGDIRSQGFDLNGSWVPWYNLHKLFAGLIDSHQYCESPAALEVVSELADWAIATTKELSPEQWQQMLACEHGGMNESLAELYAITGNAAYLDLAKKFYHHAVLDALVEGRDELGGKHANTQIPKVIGAARLYQLTGDEKFGKIADFFWHTVIANHTYATGGNSDSEHFGPSRQLSDRLGPSTTETCNTYNMLKLTSALFSRDPRPEYAEYAERALWNHILAARHPESGRVCYYLTLKPGATRRYMGDLDFTCCNGSGMETPIRTADYLYYHAPGDADAELWVNQFIPSEAVWKDRGVTVRQETEFPNEPRTKMTIQCEQPTTFALHLRHPRWVKGSLEVTINGEKSAVDSTPGRYATIERKWKSGDAVTIELPLGLHTESMPDNENRVAVFDGPILLAGDLRGGEADSRVPVLVTNDQPLDEWLAAGDKPLAYRTAGVGRPRDVPLLPFYAAHDMPATVFWDVFDDRQWAARQAQYEAEQKRRAELDARTIDQLATGEMQAERDHSVEGEKTGHGDFNGRKFRHAWDGGWFSCELAVPTDGPAELIVDYWGSETGTREFDVQVDGKTIATTRLQMDAPGQFWDKSYPLPDEMIAGKEKIIVRFAAKPRNYAGGVFGIRVARPE
jgi:uncharacterized protein